jgi:hypothetical protein
MNYDEVITHLMTLGAIPLNSEDSNFTKLIPGMFHYAEGRIYRDLAFLATDTTELVTVPALEREVELPDNVLTVRSVGLCTPSASGPPDRNKRRHYPVRLSPEALEMFWPQPNFKPGMPKYYAIRAIRLPPDITTNPLPPTTQPEPPIYIPERFRLVLHFAPSPDRILIGEVYGGIEPLLLSRTNPETFLSRYYAELLIACCMVYITGYQRDFGAQADDPARAVSWESQYQAIKSGITQESGRLRGEGPGFTALPPAPQAQQPRSP